MEMFLTASSSPHIKAKSSTQRIMLDVVIALIPALIAGVYFFHLSAVLNVVVSVLSCVLFEYLWNKGMKKPQTITDCSAIVTGVLLAMSVSPATPWWLMVVGAAFAILIVKQLFGGIGMNFMNPALAARAMLMVSWPTQMTTWSNPATTAAVDSISGPTPLAIQKMALQAADAVPAMPSYSDLFFGRIAGTIGETCALALLLGGLYLLVRRVITWEIPVLYLASTALMSFALGLDPLVNVLSGGLLLGAFFMATDYTTSPMTRIGKCIFAVGCGLLTMVIRVFGGYPEGVSYAILLMNLLVPLIDKALVPKPFGSVKEK